MTAKTLAELSDVVGGHIVGCDQTAIASALPLQDATAGCITLVEGEQPIERVNNTPAAAVLVSEALASCDKPMLVVADLHAAFQQLIDVFRPPRTDQQDGVHVSANIDSTATIGADTSIGMGVNIGPDCVLGRRCTLHSGVQIMAGCTIGDDCVVFPNAVLHVDTKIGDRCLIQAGVVLGSFGFGYKEIEGVHRRSAQRGWVELGNDVEVGANTTVDRGTYGPTKIGHGTKLDNLVQIGHNCQLGQHNLVCAHVGIAGSCTTGDYVVLAGQVGLADHVHLGNRAVVGAQAGVMRDVQPDETVFGSPAVPRRNAMQQVAFQSKFPEMRRQLRELKKELRQLQAAVDNCSELQISKQGAA